MAHVVRARSEVPVEFTWDVASVFPSDDAWDEELAAISAALPGLEAFRGRLGESPVVLADWLQVQEDLFRRLGKVTLYARMRHNVETADQAAKAMQDRATSLAAQATAAAAFAPPEILAIMPGTLRRWMQEEPRLTVYEHYVDRLEARRAHIRSAEVEQLLGLVEDPFDTAAGTHRTLTDTDLTFQPAVTSSGETVPLVQGNYNALQTASDRELRRTSWESYADAHLTFKNTMANALTSGVKQDVFMARARYYPSSLEAALGSNHIPPAVFHSLIDTYRRHLPIWHRYWRVRRRALGYDKLYPYDVKAPLTSETRPVPYEQAQEWIVAGMQPLGEAYVTAMGHGLRGERWVDVYPNQGKRSGAYSSASPGTHPFILMSYNDDLFSMSTLAHELGHSLHSYHSHRAQPFVYARYGIFLAEVASNFNQAMVRAHLLHSNSDPDFQIAVIEEAMSNFHRYFFIMPALARFELEIHQRVERGEGLTAEGMIQLMSELFAEGFGGEVEMDRDRVGITWAEFSGHLYMNFYVFQYATGISAAHALAQGILEGRPGAVDRYLGFLRSGGSRFPLETLQLAGVDMTSPEPVEQTFGVMAQLIDRLEGLLEERAALPAVAPPAG